MENLTLLFVSKEAIMQKWEYCTVRRSFGVLRSGDTSSKMFLIVNGTVAVEREIPLHDTQEPRGLAPEKIISEFLDGLGKEGWELVSDGADSMIFKRPKE
jgi:hypothetical protein